MKKSLKIIISSVVLLALVGAYFLVKYMPRAEEPMPVSTSDDRPDVKLVEVDRGEIRRMVLEKDTGKLTFVRDGDSWEIDYPYPLEIKASAIEDLLYSFSNLRAEKIIAENPEDLSVFGLSPPAVTATVETSGGKMQTVLVGNRAPSGYNYYMRTKDGSTVYTVAGNHGYHFLYELSEFRMKDVTEAIDYMDLAYLYLKTDEGTIEINAKKQDEVFYEDVMGAYKLSKPYSRERGMDSDKFGTFLEGLPQFEIRDFADDAPEDLSVYGLENPRAEFRVKDRKGNGVHVYYGKQKDSYTVYARFEGDPRVVELDSSKLDFLNTRPFTLVGKFSLILNIDSVERIEIRTPERTWEAEIQRRMPPDAGPEDEPEDLFFMNGIPIEDKPFREYYQTLIGLMVDGENTDPSEGSPVLTLTYFLNDKGTQDKVSVSFVPFNRDFYQVYRDGISDFVISRDQVHRAIEKTREIVETNEKKATGS